MAGARSASPLASAALEWVTRPPVCDRTWIRSDEREVEDENYFQRELYWGSFSRTILLPEEVDVERAEATEKHGILMIRLPKINKKRETKLKVRMR